MKRTDHGVTRCRRWYELNLCALRVRELYRADGVFAALLGLVVFRLPGLLGMKFPGGMVFPAEVTVVWDVPVEELDEPDDLVDLGFRPLVAYELPEFSGENDTLLLRDRDKTTYCEVIYAKAKGITQTGIVFSSYLAGDKERLLKTVQTWKASPLDRPDAYPMQCVAGKVEDTYEAHREWVASFGGELVTASRQHFLDSAARDHRVLLKHYAGRGVYIEARPDHVRKLLKEKRLKRESSGEEE